MNWSDYFTYDGLNLIRIYDESKPKAWNSRFAGKVAGSPHTTGYVKITCNYKYYLAHRIIWEMHNGKIPKGMEVDHINHIKNDNRIENLSLVSRSVNSKNLKKDKRNKSGFTGVVIDNRTKMWVAQIQVKGERIVLYYGQSFDEAVKARKAANIKYSFHKNHGA